MNVQEFKRWAEGQRIPATAPAFESAKSEQPEEREEPRVEVRASADASNNRAARFLGTLRWGK